MWVGSERNSLCASANEESDSLVNNALSHVIPCSLCQTPALPFATAENAAEAGKLAAQEQVGGPPKRSAK